MPTTPGVQFALVTGCGSGGIGHALTKQLRAKGLEVFSTLLPFEDQQHLEQIGAHVLVCDITKEDDVVRVKETIQKTTGGYLSVLINNAGICYTMTAADTEVSEVEKMFAVNVFGHMRVVHHFHRMIVQAKGVIVNIGSVGGIVPYVYGASYNASKAALHHYGNTLRVEMKPFGVRVVNVISGEVSTNVLKTDQRAQRQLPPASLYRALATDFVNHIGRTPKTITPDEYAMRVIKEITNNAPKAWLWHGARSGFVRWCDMLLPRTFWDVIFWREFSFGKLSTAASV
ncbi:short chain dehydrogenase [Annulohypoxylon bovei var. microspora]|nr:short chain dehydrogenase [Annulohypoxylon bovei var. microspora]